MGMDFYSNWISVLYLILNTYNVFGKMVFNLRSGVKSGSLSGITEVQFFEQDLTNTTNCNWGLSLKASFNESKCLFQNNLECPSRRPKLEIRMSYGNQRDGWLFHVGDSPTNDGFGGDAGNFNNHAEVYGLANGSVISHGRNVTGCLPSQVLYSTQSVLHGESSDLLLYISDESYNIVRGTELNELYCDSCLFALNGQDDSHGPDKLNYDIYIAFNRVITGRTDRQGFGVCQVELNWMCNSENTIFVSSSAILRVFDHWTQIVRICIALIYITIAAIVVIVGLHLQRKNGV